MICFTKKIIKSLHKKYANNKQSNINLSLSKILISLNQQMEGVRSNYITVCLKRRFQLSESVR